MSNAHVLECYLALKESEVRPREMIQQLRASTALVEDQKFDPSTHIGWLTTACNSISMGSQHPLSGSVGTTLI